MINMIIIDLLEHRWAVQLGLTADGGDLARPNAIFFRSHLGTKSEMTPIQGGGGSILGSRKMKNSKMKILKCSKYLKIFVYSEYIIMYNPSGLETARTRL